MRKKAIGICAWLLAAAALAGCSGKKDEVKTIQERGELRVAVPSEGSLHMTMEDGTPTGLEADIVQEVAQALGVKVTYVAKAKSELLGALDGQEADLAIGGISRGGVPGDSYRLSQTYEKGWIYGAVPEGFYGDTLGALDGGVLGVPAAMSQSAKSKLQAGLEQGTLQEYASLEEAGQDLAEGAINAYFCYRPQAETLLEFPGVQVQNIRGIDGDEYVIAVPLNSSRLLSGIDTILQNRTIQASE